MAVATVTDAMRRAFIAGPTDHGRGLRGGFANAAFDDMGFTVDLALDDFVEDLGATGQGRYDFETGAIDAERCAGRAELLRPGPDQRRVVFASA